jgi:lipopolysaccharide biosynthesis protein|tara:strand:- start:1624 stop:2439 length:816 start_codon:yes stop_codon:yes gene_type:complete
MNQKKNYLIFAHYHSKGLIRKDILDFLNESKKFFIKIIFVSTKINHSEIKKISKGIKVIKRKNIGYDFYSYKIGWEYLCKKLRNNYDNKNLFFINSSILFIKPNRILNLIKKTEIKKNEFWGISRSLELTDHIQSYFFFLSCDLFKNKSIFNWWKKIKPLNVHYKIILQYELGLSKLMIKNNIKLMSIYKKNINLKTKNIFKKTFQRFNEIFLKTPKYYKKDPTNYFWKDFYAKIGIVKIKLVKDNDKKYNLKKLYNILKRKNLLNVALNN